jgi:uncharacterized protein YegP (UPF0339 family)
MSEPRIEIYKDAQRRYRWRLLSSSGRIMADSGEGYSTRNHVRRAIIRTREMIAATEPADG